jgi:putative transposase
MARGIEGRKIFVDDEDRKKFISLLQQGLAKSKCRLYAWSLLDNHYHILLRVTDAPLSEMMRRLNSTYARYFNAKYKRRGYLFQERYKSIVTQDQHYVEEIIRYVHLNPIRAGLYRSLRELVRYRWCGHGVLMGERDSEIQETSEVLRRFGKTITQSRKAYYAFMKEGLSATDAVDTIWEAVRRSNNGEEDRLSPECWVIGDHEFVKKILQDDKQRRMRLARFRIEGITIDDVGKKIAEATGVTIDEIRRRSRGTRGSDARKVLAYVCNKVYGFPVKMIGGYLGISGPPVSISIPQGETLVKKWKIILN